MKHIPVTKIEAIKLPAVTPATIAWAKHEIRMQLLIYEAAITREQSVALIEKKARELCKESEYSFEEILCMLIRGRI